MIHIRSRTLTIALAGCCAWAGARAAGMPPEQAAPAAQTEVRAGAAPAQANAQAHAAAMQEHGEPSGSQSQAAPAAGEGMR